MDLKNHEEKSFGTSTNQSFFYTRMIVNLIAVIVCMAASIIIICTKWAIDQDIYAHVEYFKLCKYLYIPIALLLLIMSIFAFGLVLDMSVFCKLKLLDDLRDWYIHELANLLGYIIVKNKDSPRTDLELYQVNHLASVDSYEERFTYHRHTKLPTVQQDESLAQVNPAPNIAPI